MSIRFFLCALAAFAMFSGCAHKREYQWYRGGMTKEQLDRDLKAAHEEAVKAYPSVEKMAHKPAHNAEEHFEEMRRSVQALYMESHGWFLVYYNHRGEMHQAPRE